MSVTVRINTKDVAWIERHSVEEPLIHGTDIKGAMYFSATIEVAEVEHVKFAGASMIRFDIGKDAPRDHNRYAMYPAAYLVDGEGPQRLDGCTCTPVRGSHQSHCAWSAR